MYNNIQGNTLLILVRYKLSVYLYLCHLMKRLLGRLSIVESFAAVAREYGSRNYQRQVHLLGSTVYVVYIVRKEKTTSLSQVGRF